MIVIKPLQCIFNRNK